MEILSTADCGYFLLIVKIYLIMDSDSTDSGCNTHHLTQILTFSQSWNGGVMGDRVPVVMGGLVPARLGNPFGIPRNSKIILISDLLDSRILIGTLFILS
jgi:hypothetical protein